MRTSKHLYVRILCLSIFAWLPVGSVHAQVSEGVSSALLSRCIGKTGSVVRQGDPAFMTIALDGLPWMTIEQTESTVGIQPISTTVTGTGWYRRRGGTTVFFRFTCVLDEQRQPVMFHASTLLHDLGDRLPPSVLIEGTAAYPDKSPLPRGVELQVQLVDPSRPPESRIIAEQVVRSGWLVPMPFVLRLSKDTSLTDRTLLISARMVLAHQTLYELEQPRMVTAADLTKPLDLTLSKPRVPGR